MNGAEGIVVDEESKAFIAHFYKYGFVGMVLEWIESGMKEEPKRLISHLDILTHGDIDKALEDSAQTESWILN